MRKQWEGWKYNGYKCKPGPLSFRTQLAGALNWCFPSWKKKTLRASCSQPQRVGSQVSECIRAVQGLAVSQGMQVCSASTASQPCGSFMHVPATVQSPLLPPQPSWPPPGWGPPPAPSHACHGGSHKHPSTQSPLHPDHQTSNSSHHSGPRGGAVECGCFRWQTWKC